MIEEGPASKEDPKGFRGTNISLEEQLQFETLISELSAYFINLPVEQIDKEIEKGQKRVCEALGIHRCSFAEYSFGMKFLHKTHSWTAPGIPALNLSNKVEDDFDYIIKMMKNGKPVAFFDPEELPDEAAKDKQTFRRLGTTSAVIITFKVGERILVAAAWESCGIRHSWPNSLVDRLRMISEVFAHALARKRTEVALRESIAEIKALKNRLEAENLYLLDEIRVEHQHYKILGKSILMKNVLSQVEQVTGTSSTVLILGETGTGKELLAREIHDLSSRKNRPMVKVNCSALPAALIESELFGHEKGAYTGAILKQIGRFELADGSTIFLDEIGDLPLELQPKLLRVLQEGQFERVGSAKTITVDTRVIAATNRDLNKAVNEGKFRKDLYYRLNIFPITIPPLRDRPEDIPMLVRAFVKQFCKAMGKTIDTIPGKSLEAFKRYRWPGNIRELQNLVERAMIISKGKVLQIKPPEMTELEAHTIESMDNMQRRYILDVLKKTGGRVFGNRGAAKLLDMNPYTLRSRMRRLGISRTDYLL